MQLTYEGPAPEQIGFLLLPRFAMVALFSAIEPLRIANRFAGEELFRWTLISVDGEPVEASNGMPLAVNTSIGSPLDVSSLMVCASFAPLDVVDERLLEWLHHQQAINTALGAIDTGAFVLAEAGLLNQATTTLHWESLPEFRQRYPHIEAVESLFEVTEAGFFGAGASASLDLALDTIKRRHGSSLAQLVREQLVHDQLRLPASRQRPQHNAPEPRLARVIAQMDRHLEEPLTIGELAEHANLSQRQLERLFLHQWQRTPLQIYLERRLTLARQLATNSSHTIMDIALACGFASASSFTRAFQRMHGVTPSALRHNSGHHQR
ncbi:GlxA family transcriptional regulator [Halomonas huangheensis]|uniref:HTH araC/xylS-type domain-containing protein n=1 Tax=Halomonas huangheensis TaxID=1178482 RepID=W1NBN6_9GAMM|nr:GlxA family transcriptional regulator [Halomonas huangheensis]ALM52448.1 AraC family transcriptional regulator [Halomonas huangheensis]ERL52626.1 hypothetical protein BJB45_18785 [Halomonas huangheensis]